MTVRVFRLLCTLPLYSPELLTPNKLRPVKQTSYQWQIKTSKLSNYFRYLYQTSRPSKKQSGSACECEISWVCPVDGRFRLANCSWLGLPTQTQVFPVDYKKLFAIIYISAINVQTLEETNLPEYSRPNRGLKLATLVQLELLSDFGASFAFSLRLSDST